MSRITHDLRPGTRIGSALSRRGLLAAVLSVAAAAGLGACQSSPAATAGGGATPTTETQGESTVEHAYGTTVVPADPQRVISAGVSEQDTLLALGVIPVAVTEWYGEQPDATWPWAHDKLGGAHPEVLSTADGFEFERMAALRPDLIIATNAGVSAEDYAKLSEIAPTIPHSGRHDKYFEPWYVQTEAIGAALGRKDEATTIVDDIEQRFAEQREAHPEFAGKKAIFLQNAIYDGHAIAYQKGLSTDFLTRLGFEIPDGLEKFADEGQAYIPLEQLSVLDAADVLIWATEKKSDEAKLHKAPGFDQLKVVQAGRSIYTGGILAGAIYFTSPLSLPYVLDNLVPMLAEAAAR